MLKITLVAFVIAGILGLQQFYHRVAMPIAQAMYEAAIKKKNKKKRQHAIVCYLKS